MKRLTETEANEILQKLVDLRNKRDSCKRKTSNKWKLLNEQYTKYEGYCLKKFDYLVVSKTKKYSRFANYKDLQQDGRLALMLALRSFDLEKGSFFWWAEKYIQTKISREANRHSTIKIPIKQTKNFQPFKVSDMPVIIDDEPDAFETIENNQLKESVNRAIDKLPEDQRQIIKLNGIKSYSISKIAREMKIARPTCIKLLQEAKQNLKNNLENARYCEMENQNI